MSKKSMVYEDPIRSVWVDFDKEDKNTEKVGLDIRDRVMVVAVYKDTFYALGNKSNIVLPSGDVEDSAIRKAYQIILNNFEVNESHITKAFELNVFNSGTAGVNQDTHVVALILDKSIGGHPMKFNRSEIEGIVANTHNPYTAVALSAAKDSELLANPDSEITGEYA